MIRPLAVVALSLCAFPPACIIVVSDDGLDLHSGDAGWRTPLTTETRTLEPFHALNLDTTGEVSVRIGEPQVVTVTAPEALLPFVRTEIVDGILTLRRAPDAPTSRRGIKIQITVASLDAASLNGSGNLTIQGLSGARFKGSINGSGDLSAEGRVEEAELNLDGSGDLRAFGLSCKRASVRLAGSGDVHVTSEETLDLRLYGSGDIRYRGAARVTQSVQGSGDIRRD